MAMNRCLINIALALGSCGLLAPLMPGVTTLAQSRGQQPHPGHEQGSGHGHGPATTGTYFFALQQIQTDVNAVSTIKQAQAQFKNHFHDAVQINDPSGLHISVVRLGEITAAQAKTDFESAEKYVTSFVSANGKVKFHFHNEKGTKHTPVIKNQFVSYNVYQAKDSSPEFGKFAGGLAKAVGHGAASEDKPHISILHYDPGINMKIFIDAADLRGDLPTLTLDYKPTTLFLLETGDNHQYHVATVGGHRAVINLQPKK